VTRTSIRLLLITAIVALLLGYAWSRRTRALETAADLAVALELARERGDWIVVHVRRADRPLGARMDAETLSTAAARRAANEGFVHVRVDPGRGDPAIVDGGRLGESVALATIVLDRDGATVARRDGFLDGAGFVAFFAAIRVNRPELERLARAMAREPSDGRIRCERARLLHLLGADARAEAEIERARLDLEIDLDGASSLPAAIELHATLLEARGQFAAAAELRRKLPASYPPAPSGSR